jgi:hypothetical protein
MAPFDNGFGDWNLSWDEWKKGSALDGAAGSVSTAGQSQPDAVDAPASTPARLRPEAA